MDLNADMPTTAESMGRTFVLFLLLLFLLALPASAGTIPSGITATINLTNFTFTTDFEADAFSARDYGIAINDSYLDVNTTYFLTINITNFTLDVYNFTANSTTTVANPTIFMAKMRNSNTKYNLKANGVFSREITTDAYGNATWQYNSWPSTPARFLLATCTESWSYTQWTDCSGGAQSRLGTDSNACGTSYNVSEVLKSCSIATSSGGGGSGGGSFSQGTPSMKSIAFSFQAAPLLKILATVFYTLAEPQNVTVSYPASISLFIPPMPGLAYSVLEIVPTFNSSKYLGQAQIDFRVNKTWYSGNGIILSSTSLNRYDGKSWRTLPTVQTGEDQSSYSFSANTTSFSLFAITGIRKASATQPTVAVTAVAVTSTPRIGTPTSTVTTPLVLPQAPNERPRPFTTIIVLLVIIFLGALLYMRSSRTFVTSAAKSPRQQRQDKKAAPNGVAIEGIVTSILWNDDFEVFDGTAIISVRFSGKTPKVGDKVRVTGTLQHGHFSATSVEEI